MTQPTKHRIPAKRVKAAQGAGRVIRGAAGWAAKGSASVGTAEDLDTRREAEKAAREIVRSGRQPVRRSGREGFTIGHAAFAKISAVEGLHFTMEMEKDLQELDRKGLSSEARRRFLIGKYSK